MTQVFTDPRFPDYEVHNEGTNTFQVFVKAEDGTLEEVDVFSTFSDHPEYRIEPEAATKRARAYFDRMADGRESQGSEDRDTMELPGGSDRDHSDVFNSQNPEAGNASLDDMVGDKVLSADDVMNAYDRVRSITDPQQRSRAMEQVRQMSTRLESAAQELVRHLLE